MQNPIEISKLRKRFKRGGDVLNGVNLSIQPGEVYGLLGINGAGKTTTFRILFGLTRADGGEATIFGKTYLHAERALRSRVAFVAQDGGPYPSMTLAEMGHYLAQFYPQWDCSFAEHLLHRFELPQDRPIGSFSGGEQRKAALLCALATRAELIVLDEPAANLDPLARRSLLEELGNSLVDRSETTIVFSTHIISDLERIADRVGIMNAGSIGFEKTLDEVNTQYRKVQVIFKEGGVPANFVLPGQINVIAEGNVFSCIAQFQSEREIDELRNRSGIKVNTYPINLEDFFIQFMENKKRT